MCDEMPLWYRHRGASADCCRKQDSLRGRHRHSEATVAGVRRTIRARRGVVLTAGGFTFNRPMVERHCPPVLRCNYPHPWPMPRHCSSPRAVCSTTIGTRFNAFSITLILRQSTRGQAPMNSLKLRVCVLRVECWTRKSTT